MSAIASSSRLALPRSVLVRSSNIRTYASSTETPPRRRRPQDLPTSDVDLVAPPDPLSNIRPVIYASLSTRPTSRSSPYSTSEFPYSENDASLQDLELEWRLNRERVDMMNHRFWATTNAEFNAQLANRLSRLPPFSDPPTAAETRRREDVLSQFYADWQANNREKQGEWVRAWWSDIWAGLKMQSRVHIARLMKR